MQSGEPASGPQRQMDMSDVAESHERLGITAYGVEVQIVNDAVRPLAAPGRDDCAYARIPQRIVEVGNSGSKPHERKSATPRNTPSRSGVLAGDTMRTRSPSRNRGARKGTGRATRRLCHRIGPTRGHEIR